MRTSGQVQKHPRNLKLIASSTLNLWTSNIYPFHFSFKTWKVIPSPYELTTNILTEMYWQMWLRHSALSSWEILWNAYTEYTARFWNVLSMSTLTTIISISKHQQSEGQNDICGYERTWLLTWASISLITSLESASPLPSMRSNLKSRICRKGSVIPLTSYSGVYPLITKFFNTRTNVVTCCTNAKNAIQPNRTYEVL